MGVANKITASFVRTYTHSHSHLHSQRLNELQIVEESQFEPALLAVNKPKNRFEHIVPCECTHPHTHTHFHILIFTLTLRLTFTSSHSHSPSHSQSLSHPHIHTHAFIDDRYRVRLLLHPGVVGSDYVNASYIDVRYMHTPH